MGKLSVPQFSNYFKSITIALITLEIIAKTIFRFPEHIVTISIVWISGFEHLQAFLDQMLKSQKFFILHRLLTLIRLLILKEPFSTATFCFKLAADLLVQ